MRNFTLQEITLINKAVLRVTRGKSFFLWISKHATPSRSRKMIGYLCEKAATDPETNRICGYHLDEYSKLVMVHAQGNPSLLTQISTATRDLSEWAKKGFEQASVTEFERRLNVCRSCEFWDSSGFANSGKCKKCGCSTQAKLRLATASCPLDPPLWGSVS